MIRVAGTSWRQRERLQQHLHRLGKSLPRRLRKKYRVGEFLVSDFTAMVKYDVATWGDDDRQHEAFWDGVCVAVARLSKGECCAGGCTFGNPRDGLIWLGFQRNHPRSGKLKSCSVIDHLSAKVFLKSFPGIIDFVISPMSKTPYDSDAHDRQDVAMARRLGVEVTL